MYCNQLGFLFQCSMSSERPLQELNDGHVIQCFTILFYFLCLSKYSNVVLLSGGLIVVVDVENTPRD